MKRFFNNLEKYLKFYFLIAIIALSGSFFFLLNRLYKVESYLANFSTIKGDGGKEVLVQKVVDTCGEDCKSQIESAVSKAVATISATTKTAVQNQPVPPASKNKQTTYISLSGPITTTATGWVDAAGTDVYIDLVNDYGKDTWVSWEAFLSVANGNGTAFARLYDVTHSIAVNGSEISTTKGDSTQVSSGNLNLWSGRNLYRVQLKSLNSFVVTFGSGRIKVSY